MPGKGKGFSKLKHENIELNTFHASESDDDDMRVVGGSSDCMCCAPRSRWNVVMTVTVLGLLCASVLLFMYFAYRDSQMTGRLSDLETRLEKLTSSLSDDKQTSMFDLSARVDAVAKQLNDSTGMLMQYVQRIDSDCHAIVFNQTQFFNDKSVLLDSTLKQVDEMQHKMNGTSDLLASFSSMVKSYQDTKADVDRTLGDLTQLVHHSSDATDKMSGDIASHQAELKNLEVAVQNYSQQLTNVSSYCHQHVDQLHMLLANLNASMATDMLTMWKNMSWTPMTSKPLDTTGHLLADPIFMANISLKVVKLINQTFLHDDMSLLQSPDVSELNDNFTKLQEQVELLGEGLQQLSHTIQFVELFVYKHANETTMVSPTSAAQLNTTAMSSSASTTSSVSVTISTSIITSENTSSSVTSTSPVLQSPVVLTNSSTIAAASNSLNQTVIATSSSKSGNLSTSSSFTTTVLIPSPVTRHVSSTLTSNPTTSVLLSTAMRKQSAPVAGSSSVRIAVTPPSAAVDEKITILENGIRVLGEFLQQFDSMDENKDGRLSSNETNFSKNSFDIIDANGDLYITVDEIKSKKAKLEHELSILLASTDTISATANSGDVQLTPGQSVTAAVSMTVTQPVASTANPLFTASSKLVALPTAIITSSSTQSVSHVSSASVSPSNNDIDDMMKALSQALT